MRRITLLLLLCLLSFAVIACGSTGGKKPGNGSSNGAPGGVASLKITISNGEVSSRPSTLSVATGDRVRIRVISDAADELHVHGYEIEREIAAGKPTVAEFTADIPGKFEVELHELDEQVSELEVQ
jgi:hypothetical protein